MIKIEIVNKVWTDLFFLTLVFLWKSFLEYLHLDGFKAKAWNTKAKLKVYPTAHKFQKCIFWFDKLQLFDFINAPFFCRQKDEAYFEMG